MKRDVMVTRAIPGAILGAMGLLGIVLVSCVDETIVYRDRDFFQDPPAGAAQFLGYSDADEKLTTCGNCHVGQQAEWVGTAHADAWAGLKKSANAPATCEGCHTV